MDIVRKHISKSGKSVLVFRPQPVIGSPGVMPPDAQAEAGMQRMGAAPVRIDAVRNRSSPLSK
ncbi:hypothetical protein H7849_26085 [Alloacidobacterium dinghuense]|uniref:Uncharacterized protein n=1 Tax=Alloacidobacterium dinghuense TaxID=2763107 RepID=A0A7G8BIN3_9BACT|nr:hypothetical protein [Alloacidobacterium dinghuense]QNI32403.1 hypothetical protein H7849_26085 [Alloacidobacterium dinghuense]